MILFFYCLLVISFFLSAGSEKCWLDNILAVCKDLQILQEKEKTPLQNDMMLDPELIRDFMANHSSAFVMHFLKIITLWTTSIPFSSMSY